MNEDYREAVSTSDTGVLVVAATDIAAQIAEKVPEAILFALKCALKSASMELSKPLSSASRSHQFHRIDVDTEQVGACDKAHTEMEKILGLWVNPNRTTHPNWSVFPLCFIYCSTRYSPYLQCGEYNRCQSKFRYGRFISSFSIKPGASKQSTARHETVWQAQLEAGLQTMGLTSTKFQRHQLLAYLRLLLKWNQAYNLTAIREPLDMVSRLLLDSLSILHLIRGPQILDVGTGAGLPGVPLAIMLPDLEFTLLDTNGKKTRFVNQVKLEQELDNLTVVRQRVERFQPDTGYDTITSRAFASLGDMLRGTRHLLADHGRWVAMKGRYPGQEIAVLTSDFDVRSVPLSVPSETGQRHVIIIQ